MSGRDRIILYIMAAIILQCLSCEVLTMLALLGITLREGVPFILEYAKHERY